MAKVHIRMNLQCVYVVGKTYSNKTYVLVCECTCMYMYMCVLSIN